jgi:hypothetical protein
VIVEGLETQSVEPRSSSPTLNDSELIRNRVQEVHTRYLSLSTENHSLVVHCSLLVSSCSRTSFLMRFGTSINESLLENLYSIQRDCTGDRVNIVDRYGA